MNHNLTTTLKEQATLYVLEALDSREFRAFEQLLETNGELRNYTAELQSSLSIASSLCELHPTEEYLQGQRNLLRGRIEQQILDKKQSPFKSRIKSFGGSILNLLFDVKQPAWAVVFYVLIAFFVGRWVVTDKAVSRSDISENRLQDVIKQGQLENTKMRLTGNKSSPIEFAFQTNEDLQVKGGLDDQNVQQLLYYFLLNDENTGNRLKAVQMVKELEPHKETMLVLISSMLSDENPGVRLKSARLLQDYEPSKLLLEACQKVLLEDSNEAVRQEALGILARYPSQTMIPTLRVVGLMDENVFIRNQAKAIVTALKDSNQDEEIEVIQ